MNNFVFFEKFVVPSEKLSNEREYLELKHHFFPISKSEIDRVKYYLNNIPVELEQFYNKIGYGFLFKGNGIYFNRLLDPESLKQINLKEDFYEFDPDLEIYDNLYNGEKLLFFEVSEGNYLAMDKTSNNGNNAIYFFEKKIADSLEEFLLRLDKEPNFIQNIIL